MRLDSETTCNDPTRGLVAGGFAVLPDHYAAPELAWAAADRVVEAAAAEDDLCHELGPLKVVAEYRMPPRGAVQRDFQVLHIDFGIPLSLAMGVDVARYTVLHVDAGAAGSGAATRIVPLRGVAAPGRWPAPVELAARLRQRAGDPDVSEGVLARLVEAADRSAGLPAKTAANFQCGLEFDSLEAERHYLSAHGLDVASVERRVVLQPGQALILDNLRSAHGRVGKRETAELHQRCLGFARLTLRDQDMILLNVLAHMTRGNTPRGRTSQPRTSTSAATSVSSGTLDLLARRTMD